MNEEEQERLRANPGYAVAQLAKAMLSKGEDAAKRVQQWQQALVGMAQGNLQVGSRTPVASSPSWVTLEVVHGGFATGNFAAGGKLKPYEIDKALELNKRGSSDTQKPDEAGYRSALNLYFVGQDGRSELSDMMNNGCFRLHVPEEAALMIAAWLMDKGEVERATEILEAIGSFFNRLRFYPEPHKLPLRLISGDTVYLRTAGYCATKLREKRQQQSVVRMNEAITVWTPLYDRIVSLFLETVEGDTPELMHDSATGELVRKENGQPTAIGGWPCKHYPNDWKARAKALLKDYGDSRNAHTLTKKHLKPKENFARLRHYLELASEAPAKLTVRDTGAIRKILASFVTAHGAPGSDRLNATRKMQSELAKQPLHKDLAGILAERLEHEPEDEGVPDLARLLVPLTSTEAEKISTTSGYELPPSIIRKALSCTEATIQSLIEQELIPSSETLAIVLPMLTARLRARRVTNADLARIFECTYRAFRKRRSLLLLNLESQVRFEELPWISAIEPWVGTDEDSRSAARTALTQAASTAISAFPQTILPNKLVKELRTLAKDANLKVPLLDELAADIFMGTFSINYLEAASDAAQLLRGTLYERYYGIDYSRILRLDDIEEKWGKKVSPGFAQMCTQLAENHQSDTPSNSRSVAYNGSIIEQAQIITTHSLASLWQALNLENTLSAELSEMARTCYRWICVQLQINQSHWQNELRSIKNCAYTWRQMLFYLTLCSEQEQKLFLQWAHEHLGKQDDEFKIRFAPALDGLQSIADGANFDSRGNHESGGRLFLGWTTTRHFLRRSVD